MISEQGWRFVFGIVEIVTRAAYQQGQRDAKANKTLPDADFKVKGASQLQFKKKYSDFIKGT